MKPKKRELVRIRGKACEERVRRGTASEHSAVVLETAEGERLILQRIGGNPFRDEPTQRLVGLRLEVEGYRVGRALRYVDAREVDVD
jgi:hypothetical protein